MVNKLMMLVLLAVLTAAIALAGGSPDVKVFDIKVSGGEYQPASVTIPKNVPVRLNFTRDAKPTCGDVLLFPALKIRKELPVNKTVSIDLPPSKAGRKLEFTCGMEMMKGSVVVR